MAFKIFVPQKHDVPQLNKRSNTQYWNLTTGSIIGYTLIQGKDIKKPYPIIYLHGGPGGHVSDEIINTLSPLAEDGFDIYFYDQVGSGLSNRLKNINEYSAERHVNDLDEIINKISSSKVILIGQSWGAVLATLYAANHSNKIKKIIFTSPGQIYPIHNELASENPPDSLHLKQPVYSNKQGNEKAINLRSKAISFFATTFNIKLATDKEADEFVTLLNYEVNKSTVFDTAKILPIRPGGGFYSSIMTFNSLAKITNPRPQLSKLDFPVLILKGQCDNIKWGFTNEYIRMFKNHQFKLIKDAGHYINIEQKEEYQNTIRNFLSQ
ncbi:MAG: alpha/beta hydrolase [Chitinophagaceae bacterium]|nr:alpha/beta hydrolase [Chitinophagaceae bacterium]